MGNHQTREQKCADVAVAWNTLLYFPYLYKTCNLVPILYSRFFCSYRSAKKLKKQARGNISVITVFESYRTGLIKSALDLWCKYSNSVRIRNIENEESFAIGKVDNFNTLCSLNLVIFPYQGP